ncbi:hypothetical protein [Saccharopolyspora sp. NPDC002686]|uniref:hypothetical protein n=1 Tax=Saccharopolyspora sp. NPDC002686 TaxID=3154541 RepID=UPI0033323757
MHGAIAEHWCISVDNDVVELPNLWWDRLPQRDQETGMRVVRDTCKTVPDFETRIVSRNAAGVGELLLEVDYPHTTSPHTMCGEVVRLPELPSELPGRSKGAQSHDRC